MGIGFCRSRLAMLHNHFSVGTKFLQQQLGRATAMTLRSLACPGCAWTQVPKRDTCCRDKRRPPASDDSGPIPEPEQRKFLPRPRWIRHGRPRTPSLSRNSRPPRIANGCRTGVWVMLNFWVDDPLVQPGISQQVPPQHGHGHCTFGTAALPHFDALHERLARQRQDRSCHR